MLIRHYTRVLLAVFALILIPDAAFAQFVPLSCTAGGGVAGGQLYYADPTNNAGACDTGDPSDPPLKHIFSKVVCNLVMILNDVLGKMYCGMQFSMKTVLGAVMSLYVVIFGVQILMGTTQLNSKEIVIRLLKIGGVWAFVTQSAWGINLAFGFFVTLITQGIWWVAGIFIPAIITSPGDSVMPVYHVIDELLYNAITGPLVGDNAKLTGFFLAMLPVLPTITFLAISWLWFTVVTLARTVISFMLAISAIAFLIALSPIFLSFMLFQATYHLFESWLRYMISYSLQIIVVFAVISLWFMVAALFIGFFDDLAKMIFSYKHITVPGALADPANTWAICPPNYSMTPMGPAAECTVGFDPVANAADYDALLPPSTIVEQADFLYYVVFHLISLSLIAYAFNALMRDAPEVAKHIVGPAYAPVLMSGWGRQFLMPRKVGDWFGERSRNTSISGGGGLLGKSSNAPPPSSGKSLDLAIQIGERMVGKR